MNLLEASISTAKKYVGQKEYKGNQGFKDPTFDHYMRLVGFENGYAWCALFAELCWLKEPYEKKAFLMPVISDCFAANAVRTYENFKNDKSGLFKVTKEPKIGDVVIWEKRINGEPDKIGIWTKGHAGIVSMVSSSGFMSIEGNTNSQGGREGIEVAEKARDYNFYDKNGLCLKGFITLA